MMKMKNGYEMLLAGLCAVSVGACADVAATEVKRDVKGTVRAYVEALEANDVAGMEQLLSTEMLGRIYTRGSGASDDENMRLYVEKEHRKLLGQVDPADGKLAERIDVESAQTIDEAGVAVVSLRIDGLDVPKPLYLVDEAGWRVNVVPPAKGGVLFSTSSYQVKNEDLVNRSFSCSGSSIKTVAPLGQLQTSCNNSCSGWFNGTKFTAGGGSVTCDYNTWGVDMYIRGGRPVCNDPC